MPEVNMRNMYTLQQQAGSTVRQAGSTGSIDEIVRQHSRQILQMPLESAAQLLQK